MTTGLMIPSETSSPAAEVLTQRSDFRKSSVHLGYEMHLFLMYCFQILARDRTVVFSGYSDFLLHHKTYLHDIA
jgi:hypothetical protein